MVADTAPSIWFLLLGSAGAGALVSSIVNGIVSSRIKRLEVEREDMQLCLKLVEMKHQQLLAVQDWAMKNAPIAVQLWDPLVSMIEYRRGLDEFRKTGRWPKGETIHEQAKKP
jgi:hypothetical protein